MNEETLSALIGQRKALRAELERLQAAINDLDCRVDEALISLSKQYSSLSHAAIDLRNSIAHADSNSYFVHMNTVESIVRRNAGRKDIEPCVTSILSQQHTPISTKLLYEKVTVCLHAKGCAIGGKRPEANLSAHLSHIESVTNITGHGWVLIDNPKTRIFLQNEERAKWQEVESLEHLESSVNHEVLHGFLYETKEAMS